MRTVEFFSEERIIWPSVTRVSMARAIVAQIYDVPLEDIAASTRRCPRVALARQVTMYLSHVVFGMSMSEIAFAFGRDRTTATHACRHIEDLRDDDPDLDRIVGWLETLLHGAMGGRS